MAEVTSLKIGLATPLPNGGEVFGVLAENADCTCFELTAPDGLVTRFALSLDALAAMVDIAMKLRSPDGVACNRPECRGQPRCETCCAADSAHGVKVEGGNDAR